MKNDQQIYTCPSCGSTKTISLPTHMKREDFIQQLPFTILCGVGDCVDVAVCSN